MPEAWEAATPTRGPRGAATPSVCAWSCFWCIGFNGELRMTAQAFGAVGAESVVWPTGDARRACRAEARAPLRGQAQPACASGALSTSRPESLRVVGTPGYTATFVRWPVPDRFDQRGFHGWAMARVGQGGPACIRRSPSLRTVAPRAPALSVPHGDRRMRGSSCCVRPRRFGSLACACPAMRPSSLTPWNCRRSAVTL